MCFCVYHDGYSMWKEYIYIIADLKPMGKASAWYIVLIDNHTLKLCICCKYERYRETLSLKCNSFPAHR